MENKTAEVDILEISETENDKTLTVKKLKEKYTKYARNHFIKNPPQVVINCITKWEIEITTRVVKEWWRKSRTRPRIIAIQLLDKMLHTAKLIKTEKDRHNIPGIETVSEFENHCKIDGDLYKIRIAVKQQAKRRFAYYYGAIKINTK